MEQIRLLATANGPRAGLPGPFPLSWYGTVAFVFDTLRENGRLITSTALWSYARCLQTKIVNYSSTTCIRENYPDMHVIHRLYKCKMHITHDTVMLGTSHNHVPPSMVNNYKRL